MTLRITTVVFYLWAVPQLCIFYWNEESVPGCFLQIQCFTHTMQKPKWEYHLADQCLSVSDLPVYGLIQETAHLVDYWAELDFWRDWFWLLLCHTVSYPISLLWPTCWQSAVTILAVELSGFFPFQGAITFVTLKRSVKGQPPLYLRHFYFLKQQSFDLFILWKNALICIMYDCGSHLL